MKNGLSALGCIVYAVMGIIQIAATVTGFKAWWGWNDFFAILGAVFVGYLPVIGTIMGIMGAVKGWHWQPLLAILFFCWPVILYVFITMGGKKSKL